MSPRLDFATSPSKTYLRAHITTCNTTNRAPVACTSSRRWKVDKTSAKPTNLGTMSHRTSLRPNVVSGVWSAEFQPTGTVLQVRTRKKRGSKRSTNYSQSSSHGTKLAYSAGVRDSKNVESVSKCFRKLETMRNRENPRKRVVLRQKNVRKRALQSRVDFAICNEHCSLRFKIHDLINPAWLML